jgi:hypothetical protein
VAGWREFLKYLSRREEVPLDECPRAGVVQERPKVPLKFSKGVRGGHRWRRSKFLYELRVWARRCSLCGMVEVYHTLGDRRILLDDELKLVYFRGFSFDEIDLEEVRKAIREYAI